VLDQGDPSGGLAGRLPGFVVREVGEIDPGQDAYELMRGVGGLCAGGNKPRYDARRLVELLIAGLRRPH
jgi:hypothetical protein